MDRTNCKAQLATSLQVILAQVHDVSEERARWKPTAVAWSLLEVINHLYDEEREDFRMRIELLLADPNTELPSIDPDGWVIERRYNQRDLAESIANFVTERQRSLEWIDTLDQPDWEIVYQHPQAGPLYTGDFLSAWVAHDFLHIRQLNELNYQYWATTSAPYQPNYAGQW